MKKYYLALDLKDDPELIEEYERLHLPVNERPAITKSIKDAGIINMEIFRTGNRLFMIMETTDEFDADRKARMDRENPQVMEWENHVWQFQQALPWAGEGEKWVEMKQIYSLPKYSGNLDIMTAAGVRIAEEFAKNLLKKETV